MSNDFKLNDEGCKRPCLYLDLFDCGIVVEPRSYYFILGCGCVFYILSGGHFNYFVVEIPWVQIIRVE